MERLTMQTLPLPLQPPLLHTNTVSPQQLRKLIRNRTTTPRLPEDFEANQLN